jgi:uncharacterized protein (TIGR02996 family)
MTDHPGFLAEILEHPDDDTPRLIYTDWLDENGQPERAAFIRLQCELAVIEAAPSVMEVRRHDTILQLSINFIIEYGIDKLAPYWKTPHLHLLANGGSFRRGFIEVIDGKAEDVIPHLDAWRKLTPLRKVKLTTGPRLNYLANVFGGKTYAYFVDDPMQVQLEAPISTARVVTVEKLLNARFPGIEFELPVFGDEQYQETHAGYRIPNPFHRPNA